MGEKMGWNSEEYAQSSRNTKQYKELISTYLKILTLFCGLKGANVNENIWVCVVTFLRLFLLF